MNYLKLSFLLYIILLFVGCKENIISGNLVITNVNVIDIEKGEVIKNQTISIENEKINSISPYLDSDKIEAQVILDGKDKYLIPSLWDMHTHYTTSIRNNGFFNLFIANGVLGVRDLWGNLESKDSLLAKNEIAPQIFMSGAIIEGSFTQLQDVLQPRSTEEAVRLVDSLHQKGADFIKVYDNLSEEIYNAISARCKELDFPLAGHVPLSITPEEAALKGHKSMEHLNGIWAASTTKREEIDSIRRSFVENFQQRNIPGALNAFTNRLKYYNTYYNKENARQLGDFLSENEIFVTPTLAIFYYDGYKKDHDFKQLEENKYIPEDILKQWDYKQNFPYNIFTDETWKEFKERYKTTMKITKDLHDSGVTIMAGTDCGGAYVIPGFSLHKELQFLVEAGLTEAEALKAATINPIKYFKLSETQGSILKGQMANLVLLNENPLVDISNTEKIFGVVYKGKYLDRLKLDALLKEAEIEN